MADITYTDKQTGDSFTAAEANEIKAAVNTKVDKVAGKGLSTNDFTTTEKNKLANVPDDLGVVLDSKVDKVAGKGLSTNDFTTEEKNKLSLLNRTYRGGYPTLAALEAAIPVGEPGNEARVGIEGEDDVTYIWDDNDNKWAVSGTGTGSSFASLTGNPGDNAALAAALNAKVNVQAGKELSTNDFTNAYKSKADNTPDNTNAALAAVLPKRMVIVDIDAAFTLNNLNQLYTERRFTGTTNRQITLPPASGLAGLEIGDWFDACRAGTGEVTFVAAAGATLANVDGATKIRARHGMVRFIYVALNTWRPVGDIIA